nr:hypothetical protein [Tanacetum cinerariifolium]
MCKAYGGEPTVDLLRPFLNLGLAGDGLNLSNRGCRCLKTTWKHSPKKPVIYHEGHEMDLRSFMLGGVDGELIFLPAKGASEGRNSSEDEQTLVGPSLSFHPEASKKFKILSKRKVASGVPGKVLPSKVKKCLPELVRLLVRPLLLWMLTAIMISMELKYVTDCHWVVAHVTPPSWKQHLKEISIEQLCDIHGRAYMRQAVLDNDRAVVVSKVIPDTTMKLIRSDDLGVLISKLVRVFIIYGRCQAFEEVAAMEETFVLERMSGYRPSSKEEYDQAGDALANASYPFLAEYVANPYASLEQLLSKKPSLLRPTSFRSRSKPLSLQVK